MASRAVRSVQYYIVEQSDVGSRFVRAFGRKWLASHYFGGIKDSDVGKRIYIVDNTPQMESESQFLARING